MNKLQKIELDILRDVIHVCEQLNLSYYLVCGSALGAAKYGGFIPWDDDIDIALLRPDYETFCAHAQPLLKESYFLQNYKTDPAFPAIFSKIRDCNTTYIEVPSRKLPINHGVFIDVFPIDGYPQETQARKELERKKKLLSLCLSCAFAPNEKMTYKTRLLLSFLRMLGFNKRSSEIAQKFERLISQYPVANSNVWCNHGNWQGILEYAPREQYGNGTWMMFEGLRVRIPENYDAYLAQKYGDWQSDPSEEEKIGHHYVTVSDLSRPYTDYIVTLSRKDNLFADG